jgi:acetoin utilization deacetylase AcuC-like enzyme
MWAGQIAGPDATRLVVNKARDHAWTCRPAPDAVLGFHRSLPGYAPTRLAALPDLARAFGVERILIADWDVHHGNGTQQVFWNDGSVLFFDTHQHPWYPGTGNPDETGEGKGRGLIVNRPFPAGSGRDEILGAFRTGLVPAAERFKPELVMVSAGFDSRAGDPLGQFTLADEDFAELTTVLVEIARQHARGRIVSVLEGGYSRDGLARAVAAHLDRLSA